MSRNIGKTATFYGVNVEKMQLFYFIDTYLLPQLNQYI